MIEREREIEEEVGKRVGKRDIESNREIERENECKFVRRTKKLAGPGFLRIITRYFLLFDL